MTIKVTIPHPALSSGFYCLFTSYISQLNTQHRSQWRTLKRSVCCVLPFHFFSSCQIPPNFPEITDEDSRLVQLPISKIRNLMKLENSTGIVSLESAFAVAKATEFFIESLAKLSYNEVVLTKKKTIQKRDVDKVVQSTDALLFLENAMDVFGMLNK